MRPEKVSKRRSRVREKEKERVINRESVNVLGVGRRNRNTEKIREGKR